MNDAMFYDRVKYQLPNTSTWLVDSDYLLKDIWPLTQAEDLASRAKGKKRADYIASHGVRTQIVYQPALNGVTYTRFLAAVKVINQSTRDFDVYHYGTGGIARVLKNTTATVKIDQPTSGSTRVKISGSITIWTGTKWFTAELAVKHGDKVAIQYVANAATYKLVKI